MKNIYHLIAVFYYVCSLQNSIYMKQNTKKIRKGAKFVLLKQLQANYKYCTLHSQNKTQLGCKNFSIRSNKRKLNNICIFTKNYTYSFQNFFFFCLLLKNDWWCFAGNKDAMQHVHRPICIILVAQCTV